MSRMWAMALGILVVLVFSTSVVAGPDVKSNFKDLDCTEQITNHSMTTLAQGGGAFPLLSYVGGNGYDTVRDVEVDEYGFLYIIGTTNSTDLPVNYSLDTSSGSDYDCFVMKLTPDGKSILFTTRIGGSDWESPIGLAIDDLGNIIVVGNTASDDFPTANAYDSSFNETDAFVLKLAATGDRLIFSTYYGGSDSDYCWDMALDSSNSIYIVGDTTSPDIPLKKAWDWKMSGDSELFVAKFTTIGNLTYSTYLGGGDNRYDISAEYAYGIAVDAMGCVYVLGESYAEEFPRATYLFGEELLEYSYMDNWGFVAKLDSSGSDLVFASLFAVDDFFSVGDIAVAPTGEIYICGGVNSEDWPLINSLQSNIEDADTYVMKLNSDGTQILYSTTFGGSDSDFAFGICLDADLNMHVVGSSYSDDFPMTNAADTYFEGMTEAFAYSISADGTQIRYSSFIGGDDRESGWAVTVDTHGYAYVIGYTHSIFLDIYRPLFPSFGGDRDGFIVKIGTPDDTDGDGASNAQEATAGTSNSNPDSDSDSMLDGYEILYGLDPLSDDTGANPDGDTLTNIMEFNAGSNPTSTDSDSDSISDSDEYDTLGTVLFMTDSDRDTLGDAQETNIIGTDPTDPDSDQDMMPDGFEVEYDLNPLIDDSRDDRDSDGLDNIEEYVYGTLPDDPDTDDDGLGDYAEVMIYGTNPFIGDTDGDGLGDNDEVVTYGSSPTSVDSDGDGLSDYWEVNRGLDPGEYTMDTGEASEAIIFALAVAGGPTVVALIGAEIATKREGLRKIRRFRFFIPAIIFLLCILLLVPSDVQGPVNPGPNLIETESASFAYTVSDSSYFTETVSVEVSYFMSTFETSTITVIFYEYGIEATRIALIIESTSIYQQREYARGSVTLEPGRYEVEILGRGVLTELNQGRTDGRNNDQTLWATVKIGFYGVSVALFILGLFVMRREAIHKVSMMRDSFTQFDAAPIE